jgi:hypothetical protein
MWRGIFFLHSRIWRRIGKLNKTQRWFTLLLAIGFVLMRALSQMDLFFLEDKWCTGVLVARDCTDIFRPRPNSFRGVLIRRIWVRIFNIRYRIRIQMFKSHIYDVDIQSYPIQHFLYYPYSNPNPDINIKTNTISVISVRILFVFIPTGRDLELLGTST